MTQINRGLTRNISKGDIADEIAQATNGNLIWGFECIALAISEASFTTRLWVDGAVDADEVIDAMQTALDQMEDMVVCRKERATLRRLIEEVREFDQQAAAGDPDHEAVEAIPDDLIRNENDEAGDQPTDTKEATS